MEPQPLAPNGKLTLLQFMIYNIRHYNQSDLPMITAWCGAYNEVAPIKETIPADTSYVLEIDNVPALFISIITTNASWCYLENYCGNPEFKGIRLEAVDHFIGHLERTAKSLGFKSIITFAYKPKLAEQFQKYGFKKAAEGITAVYRSVA